MLSPERIRVAQPQMRDNAVTVGLGVDVRGHVVVLDHSPEPAQNPPLPPLAPLTDRRPIVSRFVVPVLLSYDEAAQLAMKRLAGKPLKVGGMTVDFKTLQILPSGQDVIVATRFCVKQGWDPFGWFDSCGDGYLRGAPKFDSATQTVRIVNVHYDIGTENILLSVPARWRRRRTREERWKRNSCSASAAKWRSSTKRCAPRSQGRRGAACASGAMSESFGAPSLTWTSEGFPRDIPRAGHDQRRSQSEGL